MCLVYKNFIIKDKWILFRLIRNIEELEKCIKGFEKGMLIYNFERVVYSKFLNIV